MLFGFPLQVTCILLKPGAVAMLRLCAAGSLAPVIVPLYAHVMKYAKPVPILGPIGAKEALSQQRNINNPASVLFKEIYTTGCCTKI